MNAEEYDALDWDSELDIYEDRTIDRMSQDEVKNIAKDYIDSFLYNKNIIDKTDSTRGHFKRGVL